MVRFFFPPLLLSVSFDQARVTELEALLVQHVPLRRRPVAIVEADLIHMRQAQLPCPTALHCSALPNFLVILVDFCRESLRCSHAST